MSSLFPGCEYKGGSGNFSNTNLWNKVIVFIGMRNLLTQKHINFFSYFFQS